MTDFEGAWVQKWVQWGAVDGAAFNADRETTRQLAIAVFRREQSPLN
jgi:hypothetical protein